MHNSIHDKILVLSTYYFICHYQNLVLPISSKYETKHHGRIKKMIKWITETHHTPLVLYDLDKDLV
jgi:hypothetical protein